MIPELGKLPNFGESKERYDSSIRKARGFWGIKEAVLLPKHA
jgi:hypothetical protein